MDPLNCLIELAWNASLVDRLRIERTIMLVMRAQEAVLRARRTEEQAWQRLVQAKAISQRMTQGICHGDNQRHQNWPSSFQRTRDTPAGTMT
jgi:hypothetical protein